MIEGGFKNQNECGYMDEVGDEEMLAIEMMRN